jgi:molybdopterin synthase sulfur carrier subunit
VKVKFFAFIRGFTGCSEADIPDEPDVRSLTAALCERYGPRLRAEMLTDAGELSPKIIIMVNGRHVQHLKGIDTPLSPTDLVQVFPLVAGG